MEKYFPLILKMADLNHTGVSRKAAANILAATINEAAENHVVHDGLLHAFLSLCQDTDFSIRKAILNNCHKLIRILKDRYCEAQLFSEVSLETSKL